MNLGHIISQRVIQSNPDKIRDVNELKVFLYYDVSKIFEVITDYYISFLKVNKTAIGLDAFQAFKNTLYSAIFALSLTNYSLLAQMAITQLLQVFYHR